MSDPVTSPCDAPGCHRNARRRFLHLTPLCHEHLVRANRRAMVNTAIVGPVLAVAGGIATLTSAAMPALRPVGVGLAAAGGLVFLLAIWFWHAARSLEAAE